MAREPRGDTGRTTVEPETREHQPDGSLPSKDQLLQFIAQAPGKVGKREIARAFGLKGGARIALKRRLGEMTDDGLLAGNRNDLRQRSGLPPVAVLEVFATDDDGDLLARPTTWNEDEGPAPIIRMDTTANRRSDRARTAAIGVGDRVLARVRPLAPDDASSSDEAPPENTDAPSPDSQPAASRITHTGEAIRRLSHESRKLLGIFRKHSDRPGGVIAPVDRKQLREHLVQRADSEGANDGDLVRFELHKSGRSQVSRARIIETLGNPDDQRQISLIAIHAHGLNDTFPQRVVDELAELPKLTPDHRADLRDLPLITIDPPDARDHDDAVHAKRDADPKNRGGFIVTVAIADVAHYVQPGTELDREALRRGNSVYFPDRVVPMLPEEISNGLCSLVEGEDRPCLAVTMVFGADGTKQSHKFVRGLMRSAKKLAYAQAQAAFDGRDPPDPYERSTPVLRDLFDAYTLLRKAREARSPLDLDLPERRLVLNTDGRVSDVVVPERLDAHKLIEEFMIQANVAAAEELEQRKSAVVYRCHDKPSKEKLTSLREFLETLDLALPPHGQLKPAAFNRILSQAKDMPVRDLVNEVVLRSQAQAEYTVENLGHFGLNLRRYAHFTSPIRRYADLLVHRALIASAGLGDDGSKTQRETKNQGDEPAKDSASYGEVKESLGRICEQISQAERKAMAAERETIDRLIASHLADRVGAKFKGRVTGVTRSGLFVRLNETGADGLVPISSLGDEYFHHVEEAHALIGEDSGRGFTLGDEVDVRLIEAVPTAGALRFEMLSEARRQNHSRTPRGMRKPGRFARGRSYKATGVSPKNRSFKKSSKGRR